MEIDERAIDADLRGRVGDIDLERSDAAALVWARFLEHARRPLNFGDHFDDDHGNDQVSFVAARAPRGDGWTVDLKRRIGVVPDDDYEGTARARPRERPDAPWPPVYSQMPDEPRRVAPGAP
jgi:hypothetical protein